MIVRWKDNQKQNSKTKNSVLVGNDFHKKLSQRSYQRDTQGRY